MNIHWERTTKADCFGRVLCFVVCMAQSTQYLHLLVWYSLAIFDYSDSLKHCCYSCCCCWVLQYTHILYANTTISKNWFCNTSSINANKTWSIRHCAEQKFSCLIWSSQEDNYANKFQVVKIQRERTREDQIRRNTRNTLRSLQIPTWKLINIRLHPKLADLYCVVLCYVSKII